MKFKVGDKVKVITLHSTEGSFLGVNQQMAHSCEQGETLVVTNSVINSYGFAEVVAGGWYYHEDDLELVQQLEVNYIITNDSVTLTLQGVTDTVCIGSANFEEIRNEVVVGNYELAQALMNPATAIASWGTGCLQIDAGVVLYNEMPLSGKLVDRIIGMMTEGDTGFASFANFLNLVLEQESFTTRKRLMDFAAHDKLDLTEEGYIIAFKNVRDDYYDKRSGSFRNMVGDKPSMKRSEVDDNHDNSCSNGLHVCSPTYLKGFWGTSGRTMKVIINPKDVVAVPYDYEDSKARVCMYEVIEDVTDSIGDYL